MVVEYQVSVQVEGRIRTVFLHSYSFRCQPAHHEQEDLRACISYLFQDCTENRMSDTYVIHMHVDKLECR